MWKALDDGSGWGCEWYGVVCLFVLCVCFVLFIVFALFLEDQLDAMLVASVRLASSVRSFITTHIAGDDLESKEVCSRCF
jgi:hypothetical protein